MKATKNSHFSKELEPFHYGYGAITQRPISKNHNCCLSYLNLLKQGQISNVWHHKTLKLKHVLDIFLNSKLSPQLKLVRNYHHISGFVWLIATISNIMSSQTVIKTINKEFLIENHHKQHMIIMPKSQHLFKNWKMSSKRYILCIETMRQRVY